MNDSGSGSQPVSGQGTGPDYQQMYKGGGKFKEQLESIAGSFGGRRGGGAETEPVSRTERPTETVVEIPTNPEVEKKPEFVGYVEKSGKDAVTPKPIVDDYTQQILLKSSDPTNVKIKLPLTEEEIQTGLHRKVLESVRWLAEWCVRQVKMLGARAEYKSGDQSGPEV